MNIIRYNNIETNINQRNESIRGENSTGRRIIYIRNQINIQRKTEKKCCFCNWDPCFNSFCCRDRCCNWFCIIFLALIALGIITIMKGCKEKSLFKIYFGIFLFLYNILFILVYAVNLVEMQLLYIIYSSIVLFFLNIYVQAYALMESRGIEKEIMTLLLNIFIGGSGTLIYGLETICLKKKNPPMTRWKKIKHLLFGIIQLVGFSLFVTSFSYYGNDENSYTYNYNNYEEKNDDYIKGVIMSVIGSICYIFSLYSAIRICCKNN